MNGTRELEPHAPLCNRIGGQLLMVRVGSVRASPLVMSVAALEEAPVPLGCSERALRGVLGRGVRSLQEPGAAVSLCRSALPLSDLLKKP